MAKRPALSNESFLGYLFSPKKHPLPAGIRKTTLKGLKGGRKKARLTSFNRMSPASQETLRRSGLREAYLRGEASLADAKSALRPQAVNLKLARPLRTKPKRQTALDRMIQDRFISKMRASGRPVNMRTVEQEELWLVPTEDMLTWQAQDFRYAGRKGSEYEREDDDGTKHNPFWYH